MFELPGASEIPNSKKSEQFNSFQSAELNDTSVRKCENAETRPSELFITGGDRSRFETQNEKRINGQIQRTRCKSGLLHQRLSNTGQTKPRADVISSQAFPEKRFRLLSLLHRSPFPPSFISPVSVPFAAMTTAANASSTRQSSSQGFCSMLF